MTAFLLVSGPFTDDRIWSRTAAALRAEGATALPVTLDRRPQADLETQIAGLVRVLPAEEPVVLVGHDYAIHPVLGAADRHPERIARIVYLDAGLPQDGDPPLALVQDPAVHRLLGGDGEPVASVPPPGSREDWRRWGSLDGLGAEQLALLAASAAAQPARTLTQPLRLTGAAAALPTTGILCTADGGPTIDGIQDLVRVGPPWLRRLTEPQVGFFELPTGHWPMLSCPEELARVLLRAAAGEGRRLSPPPGAADPSGDRLAGGLAPYLRPFPLDVPVPPRERNGRLDLYPPGPGTASDGPLPAVLFVHGGPVPPDLVPAPRDWPLLRGYAAYTASLGAVGALVEHRLHGLADYPRAAEDVAEALDGLQADPRVDPERIALWYFSAGGLLSADWLAGRTGRPGPPPRCVAFTYPVLAPLPGWGATRLDPTEALAARSRDADPAPAIVLTRVGLEIPQIAATVEQFLRAAEKSATPVEVLDVPDGTHGFETREDHPTPATRTAVTRSVRTVLDRLRSR
ncbi:alpha/beta hydrolase fold domain-containing protein [Phaeacidiphilus oryzae]|uniref:alpha/beta hydrolase fold domain-containing protein n=1 Tax=Phaeacidiphilus oryzae TaxID=348818 RepID=UPI00056B3625|nr:alpha/beta hydrolase fold domain-containing protein [Phaeacidiphilus oryzae]